MLYPHKYQKVCYIREMDSKLTSRNYYILHIIYIIIIYYSLTYIIIIYYIDTLFPSRRKSRFSPNQN